MADQKIGERIQHLLRRGRFPGSAVFAGPDGSGKYETAVRTARALNCAEPDTETGESCGRCMSCRKIAPRGDLKHLDVRILRPEGRWFKIDQIRRVSREIYFRPYEGKKRIFILDKADKMTVESANALLKVLEEPPLYAHLMLLCSSFLALLPTIRSRCLLFRFGAMSGDKIAALLQQQEGLDPSRAEVSASLVRAVQLRLDGFRWDDFALNRNKILMLLDFVLLKRNPVALLDYLEYASLNREDMDDLTKILITVMRDILALRCGADSRAVLHKDLSADLRSMAEGLDYHDISRFLENALRAEKSYNRNVNKKLAFESLLLGYYRHFRDKEPRETREEGSHDWMIP